MRPIALVAYAEDALEWHLERVDATPAERSAARLRVTAWRRPNPISGVRIIRGIRGGGG